MAWGAVSIARRLWRAWTFTEGLSTPLAQQAYEEFYDYMGGKPVHATLATHWARLVEMLHAGEKVLAFARHEELTDPGYPHHPDRDAYRRHRYRRGAARTADAPLYH